MHTHERTKGFSRRAAAGTLLAIFLAGASVASAFQGGTLLTSRQERAGIFALATYDGTAFRGWCTATVLYSSQSAGRTWLVTAAHCFSYRDDLFYVYGHFALPGARVVYDTDSDTSGTSERLTGVSQSTVYRHPEWLANGGHTSWFGPRDMAFVRVDAAIPIYDDDGVRIPEYRRPIYTGSPLQVSDPFSSDAMELFARNVFCGQAGGALRCDRLSNLWFSPTFRHQFFQLPAGAWGTGFYEAGDSGGPLLKYAPGLALQWEGAGSVLDGAQYGVVLGVLQGPTVFCDYIQNGNCDPADGLVTRFEGVDPWLATIPNANEIPRVSFWTFGGLFSGGVGTTAALAASTYRSYTFPAYAGRIVGVGVDKATNRVHAWYDNGFLSVGTYRDLDAYSQAPPPMSDTMPTRTFSSASGRPAADIVAMMIGANGRTYSWYRDGTTATGDVGDLDSIQAPRSFSLPPGKTVDDIVAISNRIGGGVVAYYRDGTLSEGTVRDLDRYAAPRPFQLGGGRSAAEILDVDIYADGRTVTLFEHPRF